MAMAEQETRRRKGGRLYKMVLILMVVLMAVVLGRQEYKIYRLHKEAEATRQRVEELQKVQADLQAERQRLYDPKYIEKLAREDHNMVGKNEVPLFIVQDKRKNDGKDGSAAGAAAGEAAGKTAPSPSPAQTPAQN
jgi:cell division protein FtsL